MNRVSVRGAAGWGIPAVMLLGGAAYLGGCQGVVSKSADEVTEPGEENEIPIGADGLPELRTSNGLRPLTRREYAHTVADLLGTSVDVDRAPLQTVVEGHGNISLRQEIVRSELETYYELALSAAEGAVGSLACEPVTDACAREFAEPLLRRAFREMPDGETAASYLGILDQSEAGETPSDRLVTLVTAVLTSSYFLFRREIGEGDVDRQGRRNLAGYEIASRLSFLVGERGPDDALLAAAEAGELTDPEARAQQLHRLLDSPEARIGMRGFVADWMGLIDPGSTIAQKNPEVLDGLANNVAARAGESLDRTVDHVLFDSPGSFLGLLRTDQYFVDESIAPVLGLDGAGDFALASLDPAERAGILMHPTVLAAHTTEGGASPFPVGKFVYENVLCGVLGPIPMVPEVDEAAIGEVTLREYLEQVTSPEACATCHQFISPPGFAFLAYDPVGRFAPTDGEGRTIDTTGYLEVGDTPITFDNAADLSRQLADHPDAARCVAKRLFRWTYGHFEAERDAPYIASLGESAVAQEGAVEALMMELVRSNEFAQVRVQP
ncbi:MAG: DUF1592 domain-containing protein [Myxococcota bacterium]